ncbi:GntR family transcriptional regulator [Falsiroseomonas sp. HW251]|uniref:GntR family transcriptional regulator n=1 Tax=Falsiroseomonas sp. HW251 TaxID=3390998 RepID=UPI003D31E2B4
MDLEPLRAANAAAPAAFGSAAFEVGRVLRDAILAGRYPAGAQIKQQPIADELGVSHIPVREALKTLESEGFVVLAARRGYFVAPVSVEDAREIWHLRRTLEPQAIAASVGRAGSAHFAAAEAAMRDLRRTDDHLAWMRLNWRFHAALYEAAGQPRLLDFIQSLWANVIRYCAMLAVRETPYVRSGEHAGILAAYRKGDAKAAERLVVRHMDEVERRLLKVLRAS